MRGRFRRTKRLLFFLGVRGLQGLSRALPRATAMRLFAGIGALVHRVDRPAVRRSLTHLEIALGRERSVAERERIVRAMFRDTGRNLVDLLRRPNSPEQLESLVRIDGLEHLESALEAGRGVVALSAHLGNWELLGAALAARGYPIHVVARELFDRRSDAMINDWRHRHGMTVHPRREGLLAASRALRAGAVVGALVDQDTRGPAVFVDFFGRPAKTPRAPFVLARRVGAALLPMWIRLGPGGVHQVTIRAALERSESEDLEAAVAEDVASWHAVLEDAIRSCPEQWVWHHRRWRSRPAAEVTNLMEFSKRAAYPEQFQPSRGVAQAR